MKTGDLVTLSAYAEKLNMLRTFGALWRQQFYELPPLVGTVIKVTKGYRGLLYTVYWLGRRTPQGRDGSYGCVYFFRQDLKLVK
jgi:hypothetical protein